MSDILKATEVFVPSDFPTLTYVNRAEDKHEKRVLDAFETPKTVISVSGPSKTGKTVLVQKTLGEDNIIPIYGAQIRSPDDVWSAILGWIDAPSSHTTTTSESDSITPEAGMSGKLTVPLIGEVGAKSGVSSTNQKVRGGSATKVSKGLAAVAREIANSDFTVFFDDFWSEPLDFLQIEVESGLDEGVRTDEAQQV